LTFVEKGDKRSKNKNKGGFWLKMKMKEEDVKQEEQKKHWELYEETLKDIEEGKIIKGKVIKVTNKDVIVDINFKSEGILPRSEFISYTGECQINPGDEVEVLLEAKENEDGYVVLSKTKADKLKFWDRIEESYEKNEAIEGRIVQKVKGGFKVDIGVEAFLPASQLDLKPIPLKQFDQYVGQVYKMQIIKVNKRRRNIILSRRIFLEKEREKQRQELLSSLKVGERRKGIVKNITDYGAFIDLGGVDGLLHMSDMSWGEVRKPTDYVKKGEEIEVVVLGVDREEGKVSLGLKQKTEDPWENIEKRYPPNSRVKGKVVGTTNYGVFVELEEGVEGLVHLSEISWSKRIPPPPKLFSRGDPIEVRVLLVDKEARKIYLGIKQLTENPWEKVEEKYSPETIIEGTVKTLTDFGAFIEIEKSLEGLLHISEIKKVQDVKGPAEMLKPGEKVKVTILSIDKENERIALGLAPDYFERGKVKTEKEEGGEKLEAIVHRKGKKRKEKKGGENDQS
jgi:small subunit ribosomal protein S1